MPSLSLKNAVRECAIHALLLLVLLAAAFPGFFVRGEALSPADILFQSKPWKYYAPADWDGPSNRLMPDVVTAFYPYYALCKREFEEGRWPLWNRFELAGIPWIANAQTAVFYPPRLLHMAFDVPTANSLYIVLKLWLCGMTAYSCLRGIGLRTAAARFGSVAWMLCGYNVVWAYWSLPDVAAWLPVLFLGVERVLADRYRQGGILACIGGTLMLFAGHPETAFTMAFGVGVYTALRLAAGLSHWRAALRRAGVLAAAWVVALLVTSVQVLPLLEYMQNSYTFAARHREASEPVLLPSSLVGLWAPRFYGTGAEQTYWGWEVLNSNIFMMLYVGLPVWAMLCLGGAPVRKSVLGTADSARYWSLVVASVFCLLLALDLNEVHWINEIPPISSTVKFYHAAFPVFALVVLGARGLDSIIRTRPSPRAFAALAIGAAIPVVFIAALVTFEKPVIELKGNQDYIARQLVVSAVVAAATLALCITARIRRTAGVFPLLITAMLAVDLLVTTRGINPSMPKRDVFPPTALTDFLAAMPAPCRFGLGEGGIASGTFAPYGIEDWLGYDGLYPARVKTFQNEMGEDVWKTAEPLYSNQYYLHDPDHPPLFPLDENSEWFEHVGTYDGLDVYRNRRALPRARLVAGARTFDSQLDMFNAMRKGDFDPHHEVFVLTGEAPASIAAMEPSAAPGTVTIDHYDNLRVSMTVRAERDAVLVLADAYYPGWQLFIDGRPADHFPVYHAFRGALVPSGQHDVEYVYKPLSFYAGLWISSLTMILACALGLRVLRPKSAVG